MDRGSPSPARTDPRMIVAMSLGGVRGAVTLAGVHGADTRADIRSRARPRAHLISMRPRAGWCARSICSRNVSSNANEPSIHHRTLPLCSGMIELKLEATADDRLRRRFDGSVARLDVRTVRTTRERTRARYHHLGGPRTELRRGDTDTDREHDCGHCHPPQAQVRHRYQRHEEPGGSSTSSIRC